MNRKHVEEEERIAAAIVTGGLAAARA